MIETAHTASDQLDEEIIMPGKLNDKIKQLVLEDNQLQAGEFSPEDQAERIVASYFKDIVSHPEFSVVAAQRLVRQTSGAIARNGVSLLCDSATQGAFSLFLEPGQSIKVDSGIYVLFANATQDHLTRCVQRISESAEKSVLHSRDITKVVRLICRQMQEHKINHFGQLANELGQVEFSF